MIFLFYFIIQILAFECILDNDCRSIGFSQITDKFCVNNRCTSLKPPLSPCNHPRECSSYSYYGPLACSAKCGTHNDCGNLLFVKTVYCCKAVPLSGKCDPKRPKSLSGCSRNHVCQTENNISKCSEKTENSWFFGAFLSISGNIFINLGVNFLKLRHSLNQFTVLSYRVSTLWFGVLIYILGKISSFTAYIFCNQSILAGLSATGLIANSILAPCINHEKFTFFDLCAFIAVFIGSTVLIYNTSKTHTTYTMCELFQMLKKTENIVWLSFIVFSIITLYLIIKFVEINSARALARDRFQFMKSRRFSFEENGVVMKYLMILVYVFMSSFIASFTTLSIKILGQIVNRYMNHGGHLFSLLSLFFASSVFLCTFFQIYWLNRALMYYDALVVIPIFHMSWTVLSIVTAGIYFQDFESFSKSQMRSFLFGIIIIFCGSIFLGLKIKNKNTIESRQIDLRNE